ncbi:MAG: hypothetical protein DMF68_17300 [Acidobacteria bacterium]|nr:MAG: hypothetical protein DMF68_17300 [Acidobacteriota bacterium]
MSLRRLISSFRVRLMLVLAALLVATLGVQYYLNLRAARVNRQLREQQNQALMSAVALGSESVSSTDRLVDMLARSNNPQLNTQTGRVTNIIIVDNQWRVIDNLDPKYFPKVNPDGSYSYYYLKDMRLPPLMNDIGEDSRYFPKASAIDEESPRGESQGFAVETDKGRWYVIVTLRSDRPTGFWNLQAARPLIYTLAVLLAATLVAGILVWQFTRPIKDLSNAARRVAAGDFDFRVPAADRSDEMGQLASRFNEMIVRLGHTRELEAKLHQAEQSAVVGRLASAIAHEIRNPLNYINLTLDHLRTAFPPADEKKRETFERLAQQLKAEVARINTRISEFLNYTRPSTLELQPLNLRSTAEDAMRMVEVNAQESHIKTGVEQSGDVPPVMGDAEALRSVFTNLIINGMQAIDGEGGSLTVKISSENSGHNARVEVMDTGRGIAPEDISKVFEPYFSTKETGTGLGLAIVKKTIDDHGGTISVRSKRGSGTTFTITLPTKGKDEEQEST